MLQVSRSAPCSGGGTMSSIIEDFCGWFASPSPIYSTCIRTGSM
jgi:hypothetical protein